MNPFIGAAIVFAAGVLWFYFRLLRPVGGNILVNGSFENERQTYKGGGKLQSTMDLGNASKDIPGWEVVGKIIWSQENNTAIRPPFGMFVELANRDPLGNGPYGGVMQTVGLQTDRDYRLTFHLGTVRDPIPGFEERLLAPATVQVTIEHMGSIRFSKTFTQPLDPNVPKWTPRFSMLFDTSGWTNPGGGAPATIKFQGLKAPPTPFIGLDNVSLELMVPTISLPR